MWILQHSQPSTWKLSLKSARDGKATARGTPQSFWHNYRNIIISHRLYYIYLVESKSQVLPVLVGRRITQRCVSLSNCTIKGKTAPTKPPSLWQLQFQEIPQITLSFDNSLERQNSLKSCTHGYSLLQGKDTVSQEKTHRAEYRRVPDAKLLFFSCGITAVVFSCHQCIIIHMEYCQSGKLT